MKLRRTIQSLVVLLPVCTFLAVAQTEWERAHETGVQAAAQSHFSEAEKLLSQSLTIARRSAQVSPLVARSLLDLAEVYRTEGKYGEAEPLYQQASEVSTRQYGESSPEIAEVLDRHAELYKTLNDFGCAQPMLEKAFEIRKQQNPADAKATAQVQNDLGELYTATGNLDQAGPLLQAALQTRETLLGPEHKEIAESLHALGNISQEDRQSRGR